MAGTTDHNPGLVDSLLETSVVGSFTSIGHKVRSKKWSAIDEAAVRDKVVLITGATSGIGMEVATSLVRFGAKLRFVARNPEKALQLRERLIELSPHGDIDYYRADLSIMSQVKAVSEQIVQSEQQIHLLINNAVVLPPERIETAEGLELSHATNLVAPFLMTNTLIPRLVQSAPARIINVISGGMYTQALDLDDLNNEQGDYRGSVAYAKAKRGLMVLTKHWAEQLAGTGVTVNATHPGWVNTQGIKDALPAFYKVMGSLLRSAEQGSDTILWLAANPTGGTETGKLWHDRAPRSEYKLKKTIETVGDRNRLWNELTQTVEDLT